MTECPCHAAFLAHFHYLMVNREQEFAALPHFVDLMDNSLATKGKSDPNSFRQDLNLCWR